MDNNTPHHFMHAALEQAKLAKAEGALPFGAVVVCNNEIVGAGKCEDSTTGDVTDHAEINALRQACRKLGRNNLSDCIIYSTSEPCLMCASAIFQAKIPHVVIGLTRDDVSHLLRQRNLRIQDLAEDVGFPVTIEIGVLRKEVLEVFTGV